MGSHGASGWEETFVGSNAEKVVRRSSCPVLIVKEQFKLDEVKSIIFAADFNEDNYVIDLVKATQELLGAQLHLVKINTPSNFISDHSRKHTMQEFAMKNQLQNYTINVYNDKQEENGIIYFAEEVNADLIALGTHGRTGLQHLLSGSIAEGVVNHSKRPVWTCKIT
jgi:K+-sensing histidine kinase KdpD